MTDEFNAKRQMVPSSRGGPNQPRRFQQQICSVQNPSMKLIILSKLPTPFSPLKQSIFQIILVMHFPPVQINWSLRLLDARIQTNSSSKLLNKQTVYDTKAIARQFLFLLIFFVVSPSPIFIKLINGQTF